MLENASQRRQQGQKIPMKFVSSMRINHCIQLLTNEQAL